MYHSAVQTVLLLLFTILDVVVNETFVPYMNDFFRTYVEIQFLKDHQMFTLTNIRRRKI